MVILIANKNIKGITVEIDGDPQGLNKALDVVDKKSQDLSNELKQVNKLLKLDPDNVVLLAQKQKILAEQVENSKEKLEKLKSVQDQIERQYASGEIDNGAYRAFQREVVDAENALERANNQINNTVKNMDKVEKKSSSFGSKLRSAGKTAVNTFKMVASAAVAFGGAIGAAALSSATFADEILTTSKNTGLSAEYLQQYAYAAELVDVDLETMTKSMAKNIKSMVNAQKGTKDYVNAYAQLGVKIKDSTGSLRDSETVYWEVIDALAKIDDETERDAISMQIFGRSAQELNSLIAVGSEGLKEYASEAESVGAVLDSKTLASLGELDDSFQRLKSASTAWRNQLGAVFAPEANLFITKLTSFGNKTMPKILNFIKDSRKHISTFSPQIKSIWDSLKRIFSTVTKIGGDILREVKPALKNIASTITNTLKVISPALKTVCGILKPILQIVIKITEAASWLGDKMTGFVSKIFAGGADEINNVKASLDETIESWGNYKDTVSESLQESDAEIDSIRQMKDNLSNLVDENGNLIGSEGALLVAIENLKKNGFDVEYDAVQKQIENYQKLGDAIENVILLKEYDTQIAKLQEMAEEAESKRLETMQKYSQAKSAYEEKYKYLLDFFSYEWGDMAGEYIDRLIQNNDAQVKDLLDLAEKREDLATQLNELLLTQSTYESALTEGSAGNYEEALRITTDFWAQMEIITEDGKNRASMSFDELNQNILTNLNSMADFINSDDIDIAQLFVDQIAKSVAAIQANGGKIPESVLSILSSSLLQFESMGGEIPESLANGIQAESNEIKTATQTAVDNAAKVDTSSFNALGENMGEGLAAGITKKISAVRKAAAQLSAAASKTIKKQSQIASPSKLTRKYGQYISEGFALGMEDKIRDVERVAMRVVGSINSPALSTNTANFVVNNTNNFNTTAARDGAALVRQINRDLGTMYYKR